MTLLSDQLLADSAKPAAQLASSTAELWRGWRMAEAALRGAVSLRAMKEQKLAPALTKLWSSFHHQGTRDELTLQQTRGSSSSWFSGGFMDHLTLGGAVRQALQQRVELGGTASHSGVWPGGSGHTVLFPDQLFL